MSFDWIRKRHFNCTGIFLRQVSPDFFFRKTKKTSISSFFSVCWRNLTKKMTGTRAANAKTSQYSESRILLRGFENGKSQTRRSIMEKVCIVGSGNWGCAIARIVGRNAAILPNVDSEVRMWVFEELVDGKKLTEIINEQHCNVKYLPDAQLPKNVVAIPEITNAVADASVIIFVLPHQFLPGILPKVKSVMKPGT
jgi:hypothetical protein